MSRTGADWLLGDVTSKATPKPEKKLRVSKELDIDAVESWMESARDDAKKLRGGIDSAVGALADLKRVGLTGEALVLLVQAKCRPDKNGNETSAATVQRVLEGLFRLGEYVT